MRNSWSFPDANACLATLAQQLQSLGESPGVFEEHRRLRESESQTQKCLCKLFPFLAAPVCCSECAISCIVPLISVFVHVAATNCSSSYFKKCLIASEWQPHPRRGIWTFQGIDQFVFIFVFFLLQILLLLSGFALWPQGCFLLLGIVMLWHLLQPSQSPSGGITGVTFCRSEVVCKRDKSPGSCYRSDVGSVCLINPISPCALQEGVGLCISYQNIMSWCLTTHLWDFVKACLRQ